MEHQNNGLSTEPGKDNPSPGFIMSRGFWRLIMYICTFKYRPEDVDCRFCLHYAHRRCTVDNGCPCIAERTEAGVVDYGEAVWDTFKSPSAALCRRLRHLTERFSGMWSRPGHLERFQRILANTGLRKKRDTKQFFAALYLLSANEDIWHRAYNCFSKKGLSFDYLRMRGIALQDYSLVQAAKALYLNSDGFTIADLEDCDAVNADSFALIINAILIADFGMGVTKIRRQKCLS